MSQHPKSESVQALKSTPKDTQSPLEELLSQEARKASKSKTVETYPHVLIGKIVSLDGNSFPVVSFIIENKQYTETANTIINIGLKQIGKNCLINFNQGNIKDPIITGLIQEPSPVDEDKPKIIYSDTGIILQCGASRIELTEDGTINIQGMHINSQAYGPNRIKGSSVKIN